MAILRHLFLEYRIDSIMDLGIFGVFNYGVTQKRTKTEMSFRRNLSVSPTDRHSHGKEKEENV